MTEAPATSGALEEVVWLCGSARKLSKVLYKFARDAGIVADEVERFANQVRSFSDTIATAELSLTHYCEENLASRVVSFLSSRNVLESIAHEAASVEEHLFAIQDTVEGLLQSRPILWASIKWSWKKSSILELAPEMESVKSSLQLLIVITQFEAFVNSGAREQQDRHWRKFRRVIRDQLQALQEVHLQLYQAHQPNGAEQDQQAHSQLPEPLLELAWSMYDHGEPPESTESPPSSSRASRSVPAPFPSQPEQPQTDASITVGSSRPQATRTVAGPSHSPRPAQQSRPVPRTQQATPPSLDTQAAGPSVPSTHRPLLNKTVRLTELPLTDQISGYIYTSWGSRHATPFVVDTLPCNIVSLSGAERDGLDIQVREATEDIVFDVGHGEPERSVGTVVFQWCQTTRDDPRRPPLTITCEVWERSGIGLVFGRPFVEERARRWVD